MVLNEWGFKSVAILGYNKLTSRAPPILFYKLLRSCYRPTRPAIILILCMRETQSQEEEMGEGNQTEREIIQNERKFVSKSSR